jgi:HEAT repeats/PBS lyase HEAT-like repeat
MVQRRRWRKLAAVFGSGLLAVTVSGCANFWDEVTSRNFQFKNLYSTPEPLVVLQKSADGDERAMALRALREPKANGGTDQDQEAILKILASAATADKLFLCRLAAIESLGRFKDPRAAEYLTNAFYNSGSFPAEMATRIQCQAIAALGDTGSPSAIPLLTRVVNGASGEGSELEKQQVMDVRIAAALALARFHDPRVTDSLIRVLEKDKDVALCDCAFESLEKSIGRQLPPDFHNWDELRHSPDAKLAAQPYLNPGDIGLKLMGWFGQR